MSDGAHDAHEVGHGNSVAAWTAVVVIALGSLVSAAGVSVSTPWLFWAGVVVMALGVVVGKVMAMMGFGVVRVGAADTAD
jgi:hypothetical protein